MKRKIEAMHKLFGYSNNQCANCNHFLTYGWRGRNYFKCEIYGISNSEATDWRKSYIACGLFNKETPEKNIYKSLQHNHKTEGPIDGQIAIRL
jgi:hypothetical protein